MITISKIDKLVDQARADNQEATIERWKFFYAGRISGLKEARGIIRDTATADSVKIERLQVAQSDYYGKAKSQENEHDQWWFYGTESACATLIGLATK